MGNPSQAKSLLALSWPLVISFTFRSVLTSIDLPYASRLEDPDAAVAAIGLSFPLEFSFIACWVGTSAALTSHLSRAMGERNEARLEQLKRVTTRIVFGLGSLFLALAALVFFGAHQLPFGDNVDAAVVENFRIYGSVLLAGVAILGFWSTIPDSIVKAHHDTKSTMIAGMISGVGNVVLNTVFLFVFELGILGIALATTLARAGSLSYALWRARALEAQRRADWGLDTAPAPESAFAGVLERPYWAILSLGVPSALTFVLMGTENLLVNGVLSRFEDATASIAAYAIYHRATLLSLMPIIAVGVAVLPFMARHLGEGNLAEVRRGIRQAFTLGFLYVVCIATPVCLFAGGPLASFLTETEETQALAAFAIRFAVPICALVAFPFVLCRPAFEGVQRGTPALIMASLRYLVFSIPLALLGSTLADQHGVDPFYGLVGGLLAGTGFVSVAFTVWLVRMLRELKAPTAEA